MDAADKRMLDREALRNMIQQWNANRLDLFELSEPNENLEFHGVMRFYFQDSGQKIATKCIRVASDATVIDVIGTLIEKFRPDMRMLSLGSYSLWETHAPGDERQLEPHEKPLLVQLNWHADDREGRFLLKCCSQPDMPLSSINEKGDQNFKRKLSKREKKELKKKEKLSRLKSDTNDENRPVAEKLYSELPETSFTRSISNPEAVMRRRRQQKLERKLQQFRSKDGGPDTGGTLKIYGSSLSPDVPYKTLLLSVGDSAAAVLREMLDKYGLSRHEPAHYCLVQVDTTDNSECILEDDECPLAIVMTHPHRSSIMFHVRRRPSESQPRRRKKKPSGSAGARPGTDPTLIEVTPDGTALENGRRLRVADVVEVGSVNGTALQLYGPSIQPRHCVLAPAEGGYSVTPLHADAQVYVNGRRVTHTTRLQHGCLLKFGRVSTFRFVDPAQEHLINRNLSQSQHFGSGSIYDRSAADGGAASPASLASHRRDLLDDGDDEDADYPDDDINDNNNTLKLEESPHSADSKDEYGRDEREHSSRSSHHPNYKDNYETTFDLDGNVETKSICSAKSGGSGHDNRSGGGAWRAGQEAILPAVLEFPEAGQAQFLSAVITRLDPHAPAFKLAPVYTLYLCARYRASTHYRPELTPTERAHKLTAFLHHVATLVHATVQERRADSAAQAFWMANASELLHFLKCDRHVCSFSTQAQESLPTTVQNAFSNLVSCFAEELRGAVWALASGGGDDTEATAPVLQALAAAMVLLRRCRVNAALTIQLFSHLFHFINAIAFNKLVSEPSNITPRWGASLSARLALLAAWAERQGLELAADCHLARTHRAARLIQGEYRTAEEVRAALAACFKLNSVQVRALLAPLLPPDLVEAAAAHARALADELYRADGREIELEESEWLGAALLIPGDGFSAEVVRGVPPGLAEFVAPLQRGGLCRLAPQPHAVGLWTVYMHAHAAPPRRPPDPTPQLIQLHKNSNGMGLSIVAAKGAGQSKLGIYVKSVVAGGAAAADGRLAAGDQLLSVDGHSLVGISQENAAEYLVRTGPIVTLEVAKQGAVLHGLATLLHQPAYAQQRPDDDVPHEDRERRNSGTFTNPHPALLKPTPPLSELATAGYGRRPKRDRCHLLRNASSESSATDDSEGALSHCRGSAPRLFVTFDRETNEWRDDSAPDAPGWSAEADGGPAVERRIPVFTFTCDEDEVRPPVPDPPRDYEHRRGIGERISLPPQMKPISTKFMLDLCNLRVGEESYARRCTTVGDCASACECCRTPQPEASRIPYIDEPDCEPVIYEKDGVNEKITTPKIRRILPSLSLDGSAEKRPATADATCQTPPSPSEMGTESVVSVKAARHRLELKFSDEFKNLQDVHCRLKRTISNMAKSLSSKSDATEHIEICSVASTKDNCRTKSEQVNHFLHKTCNKVKVKPDDTGLARIEKKSWKSPDEYRPAFGKVRALTERFNEINLTYCVKNYKRNCKSSPDLSVRPGSSPEHKLSLPVSTSLADIQYEQSDTDTSRGESKLSEEEVKSILIQLEDWSKFGSRGSEDTLAQGNEFELPNLPSEDDGSFVFTAIDKKPRIITLDSIKLNSKKSEVGCPVKVSKVACKTDRTNNWEESRTPRIVDAVRRAHLSSWDVSTSRLSEETGWGTALATSCPELSASDRCLSCPTSLLLSTDSSSRGAGGSVAGGRRASERDLPSRLAAEPVKPSKSTPALHQPPGAAAPLLPQSPLSPPTPLSPGARSTASKSRSSHNLSSPPVDSFYQNLSSVHDRRDSRWSSLRSSGGGRPQSAHFDEHPADLDRQQVNQANARAAKLAEMADEVTRRQQLQYQHLHHLQQQQQQHSQQQMYHKPPTPQMYAPAGYDASSQPNSQPASHSVPSPGLQSQQGSMYGLQNIQGTTHGLLNVQGSTHGLQNIQGSTHGLLNIQGSTHGLQNIQGSTHGLQNIQGSTHGLQNIQGTTHGLQNIQGSTHGLQNIQGSTHGLQNMQGSTHGIQNLQGSQAHHSHNQQPTPQLYAPYGQPQRYEWAQAGPPSPQRTQPPVAPKPPGSRRSELDSDELGTTACIRPDEEQYVASAQESASAYATHNPWQREERERQAEARRAAARARRDHTIAQLSALGSARTAAQGQQLRALQLERDFERRATQHQTDEGGNGEGSPEDETPPTELPAERDSRPHGQQPQPHAPKSILKTNTRADAVNGFHAHASPSEESRMSELSVNVSGMSVSAGSGEPAAPVAPTPPERGSSFAVMATRRPLSPQSPAGTIRDKRVSFHERASEPPPAPPASSPPPLEALAAPREDPDRFLEEAESMLEEGEGGAPHASPSAAHTPGVIGAQEVYRDPRARRLAEQRARAAPAPVPEHLSFKEKMKMFALESGEASTPKDKVKISRAQRDIDAVH